MKKPFFALLALSLLLAVVGCPSHTAPAPEEHRVGSFNPTCTGTGLPHVVSGVQTAACSTIVNADVGTGAIAASKIAAAGVSGDIAVNQGTVLSSVTNVQAGSNFISIGASPAATGNIRGGGGLLLTNNVGGVDRNIVQGTTGADVIVGDPSNGGDVINRSQTGGHVYNQLGGANYLTVTSASIAVGAPIIGDSGGGTYWSAHGKTTVATAPPFTLAAAAYALDAIMLSNAGAGTVTFPTPADDAHAYYKTVINTGAGTKTLSNGAGSTPTLATNLSGRYLSDLAGMHLVGTATAYP